MVKWACRWVNTRLHVFEFDGLDRSWYLCAGALAEFAGRLAGVLFEAGAEVVLIREARF